MYDLLTEAGRPLTPSEVDPLLQKNVVATRVLLWQMAEKGLVVSEGGAYALPVQSRGRR